jgi:hypothetical protein
MSRIVIGLMVVLAVYGPAGTAHATDIKTIV